MNYRKIIGKFIFWLAIAVISLTGVLVFLVELAPLSSGYLQKHRQIIENWASSVLEQPIQVKSIDVISKKMTPILRFKSVTVFNEGKSKTLAKVNEIQIGLNVIKSLVRFRLNPSRVSISGTHLSFYKNPSGDILLIEPDAEISAEISSKKTNISLNDVLEWLFTQKEVYLEDVIIDWYAGKKNDLTCRITNLYLNPGDEIKSAAIVAEKQGLSQKAPTNLNFAIELPRGALQFSSTLENKELTEWLNNAFIDDMHVSGSISLYGVPSDQFLLAFHLHNANLNYYANWPVIRNIDADILFDGKSLKIIANSGNIGDAPFHFANVEIKNFNRPVLVVKSKFNTSMAKGFYFVQKSPLKSDVGENLKNLVLDGPLYLELDLRIPLARDDNNYIVKGRIDLKNNALRVPAWKINVENLFGNIFFTERNLEARNLTGLLFGQETHIDIHTKYPKPDQRFTVVDISGAIDGSILQSKIMGDLVSDAKILNGITKYKATLQMSDNREPTNALKFVSDLEGMNINVPAPLHKKAEDKVSTKLIYKFKDTASQSLTLAFGKDFIASSLFSNIDNVRISPPKFSVTINTNKLNWADWYNYLNSLQKGHSLKIQSLSNKFSPSAGQMIINVGTFIIMGQDLHAAKINVKPIPELKKLAMQINSTNIQGDLNIFYDRVRPVIKGQFAKLYLRSTEKDLANFNPKEIPTLSVNSNDFRYNKRNFGAFLIETVPIREGLSISNLSIRSPSFSLKASGKWTAPNEQESSLRGELYTPSLGNLLKEWNLGKNVEKGHGNIKFELRWPKAIFTPDFVNMTGELKLRFKSGRIVNLGRRAEAGLGAGRFLNLFSLQSLPRRLTLDFSDLVKKGFSFDYLRGTLKIRDASIYTDDMHLEGIVAHVYASGRIGYKLKDYDLRLMTTPHITSSLPVVATILGGPIAGAATWVADKLLSHQVKKATTTTYLITGSWVKPNIIRATN